MQSQPCAAWPCKNRACAATARTLKTIAQSATEGDTIMLFVSGHGYRAPDNKLYLVIKETEADNVQGTALPWDELASAFDGTRARIIAFIDACHSGAVPDGGNDEIAGTLLAHRVSFTVIAAAKGGAFALGA